MNKLVANFRRLRTEAADAGNAVRRVGDRLVGAAGDEPGNPVLEGQGYLVGDDLGGGLGGDGHLVCSVRGAQKW